MTGGDALAAQTLALVDVPSVSRDEAAIVDAVRAIAATGDAFDLLDDEDTCLLYLPSGRGATSGRSSCSRAMSTPSRSRGTSRGAGTTV